MAKTFSSASKILLQNHIRHADSHNKIVEEAEMWRSYEQLKKGKQKNTIYERQDKYGKGFSFLDDQRQDMSTEFFNSLQKRAHMDDEIEKSTYFTKQLQKLEEADPDRWGHNGYKELYPQDFLSDSDSKKAKQKKKKSKKKKHKKHKKHKKKTQSYDTDSSGEDNDFKRFSKTKYIESSHKKRKKLKYSDSPTKKRTKAQVSKCEKLRDKNVDSCMKRKKSKKRTHEKIVNSENDSSTDSDTEKRKRRKY